MKRLMLACMAGVLGASIPSAQAAGSVELGKAKALYCVTCHGADGKRELPMLTGGVARLAGMAPQRFIPAMNAYRYGRRFHPMMQFFVMPLNDADLEDMAAYFASLGTSP